MALSLTNRGTGTHNTGASSFTLSPGSNCTAGALVALCVAADNSSSGGSTNDFTTVTDSLGNTWTKQRAPVFDNGAASAGVQGAIYTTPQNGGTLQTSTVITVNFGSSPVAKTWTLTEIAPSAGRSASVRTGGDKSAGATGTALTTGASVSVTSGECILAAFFIEAGTTQTLSAADTDTTNGSWSTNQYAEIGSTTSGSVIVSQGKVVTGTGTQTYDVTLGISSDYHGSYIIVQQDVVLPALAASSGSVAITGTAADFRVRLDAETANVPISGTAATVGRKLTVSASAGAVDITGSAATLTYIPNSGYTLTADAGAVPITGTAATVGRKLTAAADAGAVPITGTAATVGRKLMAAADAGAVPITGTAAGTRENHLVSAQAGAVPISGTAASLKENHLVSAQAGSVPITGTDASLSYNTPIHTLPAVSGSVPITGAAATVARKLTLSASGGSVSVAGTAAAVKENHLVSAQAGSVPIAGTAAGTRVNHPLTAQAGSVPIAGSVAALKEAHLVSAQAGAVPIAGTSATLVYDQPGEPTLVAAPGVVPIAGPEAFFAVLALVVDRPFSVTSVEVGESVVLSSREVGGVTATSGEGQ